MIDGRDANDVIRKLLGPDGVHVKRIAKDHRAKLRVRATAQDIAKAPAD